MRVVRSPDAPKITIMQRSAMRPLSAFCGFSAMVQVLLLARGVLLDVSSELLAHRRQHLLGERMILPRAEPHVKGRCENVRGHGFFEGRLYRPATLARILHEAGEAVEPGIL